MSFSLLCFDSFTSTFFFALNACRYCTISGFLCKFTSTFFFALNACRLNKDKFDELSRCFISSFFSLVIPPNMAYHEHFQVVLEDLEPKEHFKTFAIAVPIPGSPPILTNSGNEAYETVLEIVRTNNYLSERATEIQLKANKFVKTLRGLAHVLSLEEHKCEETNLHISNIARLIEIAERDADIGYKVSRIQLLKFDTEQHILVESKLAAAYCDLINLEHEFKESVGQMKRLTKLKKAIDECIKIGHNILALF